jgi:hypothetical protein
MFSVRLSACGFLTGRWSLVLSLKSSVRYIVLEEHAGLPYQTVHESFGGE